MALSRRQIEARFRRGTNALLGVGVLSGIGNALLYSGLAPKSVGVVCLAIPVVLDTVVRVVDPRLWGHELHYYCFIFSLLLSGVFVLLGLACKLGSHGGATLAVKKQGVMKSLGNTQLFGSRLAYVVGIALYVLDGALALVMESFLRTHFDELRVLVLANLGFHCLVLSYLGWNFAASLTKEAGPDPFEVLSTRRDSASDARPV